MGGQASKLDKMKAGEKASHRKKYLPQTNGSSPAVNGMSPDNSCPSIEEQQVELPSFTERQKELVTDTWRVVQEDMAKVGVVIFIK
ncbi:neuroglobin [Biomphalaria glabrata]|nr:neuroglobin [Biomphalaria glabrata]